MEHTQRNRLSNAERETLQQTLKQSWQDMYVLTKPEEIIPYECDGLAAYREIPLAVVLPETEEQVQRVLKTCKQMNIPVVPRGAGTGLAGSAMPIPDGVVLSMAKFNRILEVTNKRVLPPCNRVCAIWRFPKLLPNTSCITHLIPLAKSPAP